MQSQRDTLLCETKTSFRVLDPRSAKGIPVGVCNLAFFWTGVLDLDVNRERIAAQRVRIGSPREMRSSRNLREVRRRVHLSSALLECRLLGRIIGHDKSQDERRAFHVPSSGRCVLITPFLVVRDEVASEYDNVAWVGV